MKKLEIITRSEKLEELKKTLNDLGINGMTVSTVMGCGKQKGRTEFYRGTEVTINLLHKIKVEIVISDSDLEKVLKSVRDALVTGNIGDGKIFIFNVEDAIRIRTGENGDQAIKIK